MNAVRLVGDLAFLASTAVAVLFVVLYATRSAWRATAAGRVTLGFMTVIALIMMSAITFGVLWPGHDAERLVVRAVLYVLLLAGLVHYTVVLLRSQRRDRRRRSTSASQPELNVQSGYPELARKGFRPATILRGHTMSTKIVEGDGGRLIELDPSSTNPVLQRAAVTAVAGLVAGVAARYGLPLSDGWADAAALTLVVGLPLAAGWWARRKAWSGATVAEVLDRQMDQVTRP